MKLQDVSEHLERDADALPDRAFTSKGDELPEPPTTPPPPPKPPAKQPDKR